MQYVGSKNRISKELAPIIQSFITPDTVGYLEPFVGGANMIDKIDCKLRVGCDIHKQLIALLCYAQAKPEKIPKAITEEQYNRIRLNKDSYPDWQVGLVGFCATFGTKYFGGYARNKKGDNSGIRAAQAISNIVKQSPKLKGIIFKRIRFQNLPLDKIKGYVIYCDIPYKGTCKYSTDVFPHEEFYEWVKRASVHNTVLISEYWMPEEFDCIWEKECKVNFDSNRGQGNEANVRIEKLFTYGSWEDD